MKSVSRSRSAIRVQHVKSPLTRVGYRLDPEMAQLVLLAAGHIQLRRLAQEDTSGIDGPRLIWQGAGTAAELVAEGGARATIVSIPVLALTRALPTIQLGEQMRRTLMQNLIFPFDANGQITTLVAGLERERSGSAAGAEVAEGHYLSLILLMLWRLARADLVAHGRAPQGLAERFILLAGQHVREHRNISEYAAILGVSRDRLGSAMRRATGHSPQSYLHELLIREASELLASTGMPVGQVAFRLGFTDPAYFTRFFTRHRGESPAKFRRTARTRNADGDPSYAAWP